MRFKTPTFILKIHRFLDGLHIPILGISLWKMFEIYGEGIFKNKILRQAAAISWSPTPPVLPEAVACLAGIARMRWQVLDRKSVV